MSRLSRAKLEGSGYVSDLLKTLAPLALSPIASAVGEKVGRYISPRKVGSGYKTMGAGVHPMYSLYVRKSRKRRSKSKSKSKSGSGSKRKRKSPRKTKKGGTMRRYSKKKVSRRRSPVSRRR
jgi:hypothetical protein